MRALPIAVSCLLASMILGAGGSWAQPAEPDVADVEQARLHFERAQQYELLEDWERAALEYRRAYEHYAAPEFLFNIGEAYRLLGDPERAIRYYEAYLRVDPEGRGSAAARESIGELREELAADEASSAEEEGAATQGPDVPLRHQAPPDRLASGGRALRAVGFAGIGAGAAALATSVYFGQRASSISDEVSAAPIFDPRRYEQGRAANRTMLITSGIGAVAVTAGVVAYVAGSRAADREAERVSWWPDLTRDAFVISARGRFR
jgi:tetratricopeptide (TPR) repeat protein